MKRLSIKLAPLEIEVLARLGGKALKPADLAQTLLRLALEPRVRELAAGKLWLEQSAAQRFDDDLVHETAERAAKRESPFYGPKRPVSDEPLVSAQTLLPVSQRDALARMAALEGTTISALLRSFVDDALVEERQAREGFPSQTTLDERGERGERGERDGLSEVGG
ncbi:hypothetical protein [Hyphomicrobium sulfonivorans]|uniref:hypothetical protein n=1 Tax=Hyphomicrobium sulfonivorans TaxID=121290 RepID=UPI00083993FD|nr:hypothetical protein [Hyphomicrobium sulfonivorans]